MRGKAWLDPDSWFGGTGASPGGTRHWRGHRRQWFDSGEMKYVILKVLRERPMHGYEVMKALETQTNGCYKPSPGTVYPTLQWLEDEGLVTSSEASGKKVYAISDAGRAFLDEHKDTVDDIFDRLGESMERIFSEPIMAVNHGIGRIAREAYRTAWKLSADDPRRKRIVEILDRAATELSELSG